jgi:hypothetical protein
MHRLYTSIVTSLVLFAALGRAEESDAVSCGLFDANIACTALSTFNEGDNPSFMELMRSAIIDNDKDNSTEYQDDDNIFCIDSNSVEIPLLGTYDVGAFTGSGGICAYPEGTSITLGEARDLIDILVRSSCESCGYVTTDFPLGNDTEKLFTVNFRSDAFCFDNCIRPEDLTTEEEDDPEEEEDNNDDENAAVPSKDLRHASTVASVLAAISLVVLMG